MGCRPTVSVIVPVFKVEAYLRRCLESICGETLADLEIIVVNDASPDNCQAIIDEYAARDRRIVSLIHAENRGLGAARNTGIDRARGEYLAFVDSDDWIEPQMHETMVRQAAAKGVRLVVCGIRSVWPDSAPSYLMSYDGLLHGGADVLAAMARLAVDPAVGVSACNKLFHRSLFEETGYRYATGMLMEDWSVAMRLLTTVDNILFIPDLFYNYWLGNASITRGCWGPRHYYSYLKVLRDLETLFSERGLMATAGEACARILQFHCDWLFGGLARLTPQALQECLDDDLVAEICRTPRFVRHLLARTTDRAKFLPPAAPPAGWPSVKGWMANRLRGTILFHPARTVYRTVRQSLHSCRSLFHF